VKSVVEDLMTVEEIAEKTGRSGPVIHRSGRIRLYSWAHVSRWLSDAHLGQVDSVAAETVPRLSSRSLAADRS
jgi:hypothetical protein